MAEEQFSIAYLGPAVEGGVIAVSDLAPSLLKLADAIQAAHQVVNPDAPQPQLHIRATRDGSFAVDLAVVESMIEKAMDLFTGRGATASVNLTGLVSAVVGGFQLIKWFRGRRIRSREALRDGWVRITGSDGAVIDLPTASLDVVTDRAFRESARGVVEPLSSDGIDGVVLEHAGDDPVEVVASDLPAFDVPDAQEEQITDSTREVVLSLRTVNFVEGNKWRVSDGENVLNATVADVVFLARIERNEEAFTRGDLLRCQVRTRQWRSPRGLHNEHTIEKVMEHIRAAQQIPLPFEDGDS